MAGQMALGHQQGHQPVGVVVVEAEAGVQGQVLAIVVAVAPGVLLRELADGVRQLVVVTLGGERATLALLVVVEAAGAVEVEAVLAAGEVAVEVEVEMPVVRVVHRGRRYRSESPKLRNRFRFPRVRLCPLRPLHHRHRHRYRDCRNHHHRRRRRHRETRG